MKIEVVNSSGGAKISKAKCSGKAGLDVKTSIDTGIIQTPWKNKCEYS